MSKKITRARDQVSKLGEHRFYWLNPVIGIMIAAVVIYLLSH